MPPAVQGFLAGITLADVLTWGAVVGALFAAFKWVIPFSRKVSHFIDDVAGEPARAGMPARPGLMERVGVMETKQDEQATALAVVRHEVTTNHGSSLKDAVKEVNTAVTELATWQQKHEKKSDAIADRVDNLYRKKDN